MSRACSLNEVGATHHGRGHWWWLPLLLMVQVIVAGSVMYGDPAEMHIHETLAAVSAAREFSRGAIHFSEMQWYLNGEISTWATWELAGLLTMIGYSFPALLAIAILHQCVTLAAWYALLRRFWGERTAGLAGLVFILAPPSVLMMGAQIDVRLTEMNLFMPLLLLLYFPAGLTGRIWPTLAFALTAVAGLAVTRALWAVLVTFLVVLVITRGWFAMRSLVAMVGVAVAVKYLIPPLGLGPIFHHHQWTLWDLLTRRFSVARVLQVFGTTVSADITQGWGIPAALAGFCLVFMAMGPALRRLRPGGSCGLPRNCQPRYCCMLFLTLFPVVYLAIYSLLRLDDYITDPVAPLWWRYRRMIALWPLCAVGTGMLLARLPRLSRWLLLGVLLGGNMGAVIATLHWQFRPLAAYRWHNYQTMGQAMADHITTTTGDAWRMRLARLDRQYLPELAIGFATSAVSPAAPPGQLHVLQRVLPAEVLPDYYASAGYWSVHFNRVSANGALIAAPYRPFFEQGQNAWQERRDWWPEYSAIRFGRFYADRYSG